MNVNTIFPPIRGKNTKRNPSKLFRHLRLIYRLMRLYKNNKIRSFVKGLSSVIFHKKIYFNNRLWWVAK